MNTAYQQLPEDFQALIAHEMTLIRMRQAFIRELRGFSFEQAANLLLIEENTLAAELYTKLYTRADYMTMLDTHNCVVLSKIPVCVTDSALSTGGPLYISLRMAKPMPFAPGFERYECSVADEFGAHIESLVRRSSHPQSDEKISGEIETLNALHLSGEVDARQWLYKMAECGPVSRQVANRMIDAICTLSIDRASCPL
jgi:hypothetical protein